MNKKAKQYVNDILGARIFPDGLTLIQFNGFVKVSFPMTQELMFE